MRTTIRAARGALVLAMTLAGLTLVGCDPYGCPTGYVEVEGRCVDADGGPGDSGIGDGGVDDGGPMDSATDAEASCAPSDEICNGVDDDCDERMDEGVRTTYFADTDADGFGDATRPMEACAAPAGHVDNDDDCDDACATCRPGGTEACDGTLDEDCDGTPDDGCSCAAGMSRACPGGTEIGACVAGTQLCSAAGEWGACSGAVGPVAETCNGMDDDCNMTPDDGPAASSCGAVSRGTAGCSAGSCYVASCNSGYRDCDMTFANGCEAQLGTVAACTDCGDVCGWNCEASGCNDAVSIASGLIHSCAVRQDGTVVCWGGNPAGQLGNGTTTSSSRPVLVSAVSDARRVESGGPYPYSAGSHSCALTGDGQVRCWGLNSAGQLGDGSMSNRTSAVAVMGLIAPVTDLAVGGFHTCAVYASGGVVCWGENNYGQLGDGTTTDRATPVSVSGVSTATAIACGFGYTCALLRDGSVRCWGANNQGQLGIGSTSDSLTPVTVSGLTNATRLSTGAEHTCAVRADGTIRCWGANSSGGLGDGTTMMRSSPVSVGGLADVRDVSAGLLHTCALTNSGRVYCWGRNTEGALGIGSMVDSSVPALVTTLASAVSVEAGAGHTCAVEPTGRVVCWGDNSLGQIGDGTSMMRLVPTTVVPR